MVGVVTDASGADAAAVCVEDEAGIAAVVGVLDGAAGAASKLASFFARLETSVGRSALADALGADVVAVGAGAGVPDVGAGLLVVVVEGAVSATAVVIWSSARVVRKPDSVRVVNQPDEKGGGKKKGRAADRFHQPHAPKFVSPYVESARAGGARASGCRPYRGFVTLENNFT